jgi:ABC-type nitrate/sulfonate/bicarbonate transport system substrate-binding protein
MMLGVKRLVICFAFIVGFTAAAQGQNLPKVRAAYTSIGIQFDPVYIMKELDLPRKYGVDAEILFVPVSSRAVQAALAGEIQFITSAGVANINANMSGGDFVGLTATLNTFVFKILASPEIKKPEMLKGKRSAFPGWAAPAIFPSAMRSLAGAWLPTKTSPLSR